MYGTPPHTVDKNTRIRIALSIDRAADLRRRLSELLPSQIEWRSQFLDILAAHRADAYLGEDVVEMLKRLSDFWREHNAR